MPEAADDSVNGLFRDHKGQLLKYLRTFVGEDEAHDVLQDVFMSFLKQKREEITQAGLNDDIDSMLSQGEGEDPFVAAAVDFPAVSEFYAADAGRRTGAEPITRG